MDGSSWDLVSSADDLLSGGGRTEYFNCDNEKTDYFNKLKETQKKFFSCGDEELVIHLAEQIKCSPIVKEQVNESPLGTSAPDHGRSFP